MPLNDAAKRQLRQDLQLVTEADYSIVLTRAEKLHPGIYTFLKGDPRQNADRVQALFESFWRPYEKRRNWGEVTLTNSNLSIQPRYHGPLNEALVAIGFSQFLDLLGHAGRAFCNKVLGGFEKFYNHSMKDRSQG